MSKMAAVDTAVRRQIASDGKKIDYSEKMDIATGYANAADIQKFLLGVAIRLKLDTPPLIFDWSSLDADKTKSQLREFVQSMIEERTRSPIDERKAQSTEAK